MRIEVFVVFFRSFQSFAVWFIDLKPCLGCVAFPFQFLINFPNGCRCASVLVFQLMIVSFYFYSSFVPPIIIELMYSRDLLYASANRQFLLLITLRFRFQTYTFHACIYTEQHPTLWVFVCGIRPGAFTALVRLVHSWFKWMTKRNDWTILVFMTQSN